MPGFGEPMVIDTMTVAKVRLAEVSASIIARTGADVSVIVFLANPPLAEAGVYDCSPLPMYRLRVGGDKDVSGDPRIIYPDTYPWNERWFERVPVETVTVWGDEDVHKVSATEGLYLSQYGFISIAVTLGYGENYWSFTLVEPAISLGQVAKGPVYFSTRSICMQIPGVVHLEQKLDFAMYVFWNYFKNAANPEWLIQLFTRESDIGGRYECEDGTSFWTVDRNDEGGRLWGRDLGSLRYVWVLPPGKTENYMLKYCKFIGREVYDIGDYPDSLSHTRGIRRHLHI